MNEKLEYRMIGLVPYNLSAIQQGIQFSHALQEYNNKFTDNTVGGFFKWRTQDKTVIILNGGTTNGRIIDDYKSEIKRVQKYAGTLNNHRQYLADIGVQFASFTEPDLGDQLTCITFMIDEKVFDRVKYPSFKEVMINSDTPVDSFDELELAIAHPEELRKYKVSIGGERNYKLRKFLKQFKLA